MDDDAKFTQSFDAVDWAKAFMRIMGHRRDEIDEAVMIGWFANAIMRGYDEYPRRNGISTELRKLPRDGTPS